MSRALKKKRSLRKKIKKEIEKLQVYLEESNELLRSEDFNNIKQECKRTEEIQNGLNDMISKLQELNIELGKTSQRGIRQCKKDLKAEYSPPNDKRAMLCTALQEKAA